MKTVLSFLQVILYFLSVGVIVGGYLLTVNLLEMKFSQTVSMIGGLPFVTFFAVLSLFLFGPISRKLDEKYIDLEMKKEVDATD